MCTSPLFRLLFPKDDWKKACIPAQFSRRFFRPSGEINDGIIIPKGLYYELMRRSFTDDDFQKVPCGQCMECRLAYSKNWAMRCVHESQNSEYNYFVTLTYAPEFEFEITSYVFNFENFNFGKVLELNKEHLSAFMKRLRRYYDYHFNFEGIRFFACGELGDLNKRPHYHIQLFNCPIPDLKLAFTKNGNLYFTSEIFNKVWGKGIVVISEANYDTAAYVARYVTKKVTGKQLDEKNSKVRKIIGLPDEFLDKFARAEFRVRSDGELNLNADLCVDSDGCVTLHPGSELYKMSEDLQGEFTLMSRNPGIAREYYEANASEMYKDDSVLISSAKKVMELRPCRYYDKLYDIDEPELMAAIKEKRKASALSSLKSKLDQTDLNEEEYNAVRNESLLARTKKLIRPL